MNTVPSARYLTPAVGKRPLPGYDLALESIAAARAGGDDVVFGPWGGARLGLIQLYLGDAAAAQRSVEEALQWFEGDRAYERPKQELLEVLSEVALARGDTQAAAQHLQASLAIVAKFYRELQATQKLAGTPDALPVDLIPLSARAALVAAAQGQAERAVTLAGLSASVRAQSRQVLIPPLQAKLDEALAALRAELSAAAFDLAWQTGQRLSLAEAFAFLLA